MCSMSGFSASSIRILPSCLKTSLCFVINYAKIQGCFNMKDVVMERDIEQDLLHWKLKKSHAIVFV